MFEQLNKDGLLLQNDRLHHEWYESNCMHDCQSDFASHLKLQEGKSGLGLNVISFFNYCKRLELHIAKICLYNFDSLKSHFNIVKLGFTGVYIIFSNFSNFC